LAGVERSNVDPDHRPPRVEYCAYRRIFRSGHPELAIRWERGWTMVRGDRPSATKNSRATPGSCRPTLPG
jgi:hypothetical protein